VEHSIFVNILHEGEMHINPLVLTQGVAATFLLSLNIDDGKKKKQIIQKHAKLRY
jgi:hypothetical protein